MTQSPNLTELFNIAVAFRHAFEQKIRSDVLLKNKFIASLSTEDNKIGNALGGEYFDRVPEDLELAVLDGLRVEAISREAAVAAVQLAEFTAKVALRTVPANDLSMLVSQQSRTTEISGLFEQNNAPVLALLLAPKIL